MGFTFWMVYYNWLGLINLKDKKSDIINAENSENLYFLQNELVEYFCSSKPVLGPNLLHGHALSCIGDVLRG
jgi:hypothetical protein